MLYHATAPCDARKVKLDAFDTTDERQKILRGDGHDYLSYLLHNERTYEVVCEEKHFKKTISWSKPVRLIDILIWTLQTRIFHS